MNDKVLRAGSRAVRTAVVLALLLAAAPARALAADALEGFGAVTAGGAGGSVVRVTNLNDSGPGSLREAALGGSRTIVFDVAGDITLSDYIRVRGSFVTIDGLSAPAPGITLRGHGVAIEGSAGAHDVIVRGLRVRGALKDGIRVAYGAWNVVIDHVSVHGSGDGNLDISDSRDVTVSWSILAEPALEEKNMLIKYAPSRVTLHHNLFTEARQRNPQVRIDDAGTLARDTTVDMRNNVVWRWPGGYGTLIWYGPRANVVDNYFAFPGGSAAEQARALDVQAGTGARAYVAGNVSGDGVSAVINALGTEGAPFPAPPVATTGACEAALAVVSGAGVRPLDAVDARYVDAVTLPGCTGTPPPPTGPALPDLVIASIGAPGSVAPGGALAATLTTRNGGTATAGASTTRLYLSVDGTVGTGDVTLGAVAVPSLAAGASSSATVQATVPATTVPGSYRLIAGADATGVVSEAVETNNTLAATLTVGDATAGDTGGADLVVTELTGPRDVVPGRLFVVSEKVKNRGTAPAGASSLTLYLSRDRRSTVGAVALGTRAVPALAAGASSAGTQTITVPPGTAAGEYYLLGVTDATGVVREAVESNNLRARVLNVQ